MIGKRRRSLCWRMSLSANRIPPSGQARGHTSPGHALIRRFPGPITPPNAVMTARLRRLERSRIARPAAVVTAGLRRLEPGPVTRPDAGVTARLRRMEPGPITYPKAVATARLRRRGSGGGNVAHRWHVAGGRCALEQPRQQPRAAIHKTSNDERHENAVLKFGSREFRRIRCWRCFGIFSGHGDGPR
jgi:hypothetical protein